MKKLILKFVVVAILVFNCHVYSFAQTQATEYTATASSFVNVGDPVPNGISTSAYLPSYALDGNNTTSWLTWASSAWLQISLPNPSIVFGVQVDFQVPWKNCKVQFLSNGTLLKEVSVAEFSGGSLSLTVPSSYTGLINQIKISTDRYSSSGSIPIGIFEAKVFTSKIPGLVATCENSMNAISYGAEKVIDGDNTTFWVASSSSSWLQLYLPDNPFYRISSVQIKFGPPCINYKVQLLSADGKELETINNTDPSLNTQTLTILPTYTGAVSQIKIIPTMAGGMKPLVYEAELCGTTLPVPVNYNFTYDKTGNCTSRPILGGGVKSATIKNNPAADDTNKDEDDFIKIYPNPTKDILTVEFSAFDDLVPGSLSVTDLTGRLVYSCNVLSKRCSIDLSNKSKGQYILIYKNGNDKKSWKIIKN